jgi:succinoglycan biosynthesis transport protein ExoP
VTRAKTERIQKEAIYNQVHAIQDDRTALDNVGAVLSNGFIQQQKTEIAELQKQQVQLAERLGPNHPEMLKLGSGIQSAQAKLQSEVAKVVMALKNDYLASLSQEQSLMAALEAQKRDALALNRKGIDYGVLHRDATSNQQIFDSLMQRTKETGISGALKNSNIRIVDPAEVPRLPSSPNIPVNLLLGLFGGAFLAVGSALFFEYLDNRIKSPAEIKTHLGLPFLGIIPQVAGGDGAPLLNNGVKANFAEALRTVRSNMLFSVVDEGGRSVVITSTGPGEGKTIVASNLALALAQAGQRVILVDADMRRPRVHDVFSEQQEPGLSNVLVGDVKPSEALRQSSAQGLWILPAGRIPPNPTELLGSKRFRDFVATLTQHFDWVLIDTPPVMAVTDGAIVANFAGGVLFVVGSEMTSRSLAQSAIEHLVNANARLIGAVLNRADLEHNAYYYSQYYRREYGDYYTKTA